MEGTITPDGEQVVPQMDRNL